MDEKRYPYPSLEEKLRVLRITSTEALFDVYMRDVRSSLTDEEVSQLTVAYYQRALAEQIRSLNSGALSADSQKYVTTQIDDLRTKLKALGVETATPEISNVAQPSVNNLELQSQDYALDKPTEPVSTEPRELFDLTGRYIDLELWERLKSAKLAKRLEGSSDPFAYNFETHQGELKFPSYLPPNHIVVAEVRGFGEYPRTFPYSYAVICPNVEEMKVHYQNYASGNWNNIYFYSALKSGSLPQTQSKIQ